MASPERSGRAELDFQKLYYSIGEVSRLADLAPSVLRFWETEFDGVRPPKTRGGKRLYRQAEIKRILRIKKLLYEDRFTIEGARKVLRKDGEEKAGDPLQARGGLAAAAKEDIRRGLEEILKLLKH